MQVTIPVGEDYVIIPDIEAGTYLISVSAPNFITATGTAEIPENTNVSYAYSLGSKDPRDYYDQMILSIFYTLGSILTIAPTYALPALFITQVAECYERIASGETIGEAAANEMIDLVIEAVTLLEPYTDEAITIIGDVAETLVERGVEEVVEALVGTALGEEAKPGSSLFLLLGLAVIVIVAMEML